MSDERMLEVGRRLEGSHAHSDNEAPTSNNQPPTSNLLTVSGLTTRFGNVPVVDDVSFDVRRGETVCLVGESGSGKSMTALSIVRLVPPPGRITAGRVVLNGRDLMTLSEADLQQVRGGEIGFVFQEPMSVLNPVLTIGSQIEETLRVHGMARKAARDRAVELLDVVHVPDPHVRVHDYPHQLSGGLRQRVLIALALACSPPLVIADEPTTALDATIQAQILELLRELQSTHALGLLLITPDLGVVAQIADSVAVMQAGRIVERAPVRDLLRSPQHPYTRTLLASVRGA
jgi:ABC-type dipeptide/oligopeptide/nickel transport system ATPase component